MPVEDSHDPGRPDPGRPDPGRPDPAESVKPRWIWRALGLSIPLHLAVFSLLYFGGLYLLQDEIVRARSRDSHFLLSTAVNNLHLVMAGGSPEEVRQRLAELAASHRPLSLRLWSAGGEPIAPGPGSDPSAASEASEVGAFLSTLEDERFWLEERGNGPTLRGMVRIRTDQRCQPCHDPGQTRGVASLTRDLSPEIGDLRWRLLLYVVVGAVVWGVLAAVLNRMTALTFKRSAARVRADIDAAGDGSAAAPPPASTRILDPMSTALFESLRRSLEDQRKREEDFASRLQHTDRLASLGRLAAGLAHEIKNPLAGIQGALEILRDESKDGAGDVSTLEVYDQMLAELGRVDSTIRALLRFARPAPTQRRETDVPELLEDVVRFLGPGLVRRGVELKLETAPDVGSFPLDAEQIRQVLVNLVTNAAEAIEQEPGAGGGEVVLRATRFPEDGSLLLAVADSGPGIPQADQERIFQPFFTSKFSGTGLGLAVADSLARRHGGRIELESAAGGGSVFFVILPEPQGDGEPVERHGS